MRDTQLYLDLLCRAQQRTWIQVRKRSVSVCWCCREDNCSNRVLTLQTPVVLGLSWSYHEWMIRETQASSPNIARAQKTWRFSLWFSWCLRSQNIMIDQVADALVEAYIFAKTFKDKELEFSKILAICGTDGTRANSRNCIFTQHFFSDILRSLMQTL